MNNFISPDAHSEQRIQREYFVLEGIDIFRQQHQSYDEAAHAWSLFCLDRLAVESSDIEQHLDLFVPWMIFNYRGQSEEEATLAEAFAESCSDLDASTRQWIYKIAETPFSFWQMTASGEHGYHLSNLLMDSQQPLYDSRGMDDLYPGDILYGRLVCDDWGCQWMGLAKGTLPQASLAVIQRARDRLGNFAKLDEETLRIYEDYIRKVYWELWETFIATSEAEPMAETYDSQTLELLRQAGIAHWQDWLDTPAADFGDLSPREAVKTPQGQQAVEDYLVALALKVKNHPSPAAPDIPQLRKTLGLDS